MLLKEQESNMERALEKKRMLFEEKMRQKELQERSILYAEALRKKQEHIMRMKSNQSSFEKAMAALDEELKKVKLEKDAGESDTALESDEEDQPCSVISEIQSAKSVERTRKRSEQANDGSQYGLGQHRTGPTKAQLAARNGITKKLPCFSGKPEEWPLFFGTYQASNEACGYTDVESLVRLQESLKRPALEWVRGQLILPQTVPRVIIKLQQLYGRPKQLLQSHLEKVRKLESPRADKLASFIPFGNAVEQLCEHLEAANLKQHLVNPLLIQDLVDKLPDSEKRQWVRFKRCTDEVTLRTFTEFLSEIVADACEANVSMEYKLATKPASGGQFGREHAKGRGAMYYHSEEENLDETANVERTSFRPCKVCQCTDHRLRHCAEFKKLRYVDRLKVVNHWKLCCVCLNDHSGRCGFKIQCNVEECRERHNPLMHPLHFGGRSITVLTFLDEGASVTLIEKRMADRLGLVGVPEKLTIKWTADITRVEKDSSRMNVWASAVGSKDKVLLHTV
ncbi:uncharacterized protein LOC131680937 [Topomyia yanbarensis]|uniref:uncharacterized protein LOC131680937 n=1 Tax=Topomyia yanbarensis TaxID=2498891 RepID=UPI00273C65C8|nr:uncharacterized protein LOC131680937 [Topomyia yanbarensis]